MPYHRSMRRTRRWSGVGSAIGVGCVLCLPACGSDEALEKELRLPPLTRAPLTTEETLTVVHPILGADLDRNPQVPEAMDQMLADGFGETAPGPGEPVLPRTLDDSPPPADGPNPKLLGRFVHLADIQLVDDESPMRFASLDIPLFSSPWRPQEGHECHILDAAVRTINRVHEDLPLDFVVLGGDNVDNAQQNEHEWLRAVLGGGGRVECDSGKNDDPTPGPANDPKDALRPTGLVVPWLWVSGNHDVLTQGLSPVPENAATYVGGDAQFGTRDWSLHGGPVIKGEVAPDPARRGVSTEELFAALMADGDGHGLTADALSRGKASYEVDFPSGALRLIVIDTATPLGGAEGVILQSDVDTFIQPALERAKADGKWVILTSHHSSNTLADGTVSKVQPGALSLEQWQSFVGSYDHVLAHVTGHSHIHRVHVRQQPGKRAYWEVITSALSDYPHQMRVIEVWDRDNGQLSVRAVNLDYQTEGDRVAEDGRRRAIVDLTSGWVDDASGAEKDRNVELYVAKP